MSARSPGGGRASKDKRTLSVPVWFIPWMGFRQKAIPINVGERAAGESKYSTAKMVRLALSGITSFSIAPLRLALLLGGLFAFLSFLYGGYALWIWLFTEQAVPGWTLIIASILFLSGIQMLFYHSINKGWI
ncbi:MAG: hypothetical protein JJU13_05010 [Balneolaceae bacterium]|nr:hypothetical protein [Balneolaceae bacterium]